ncbi:MAG: L,D-transpeptidase family protein [Clostridia bacterium]|nr:L,D-transpeptidase family protein [Clostridia bacterium]
MLKEYKLSQNKVIVLISSVIVLILIYFGMSYYYRTHFSYNTTINGVYCGNKTVAQANNLLKEQAGSYELLIHGRKGIEVSIDAKTINLETDFTDELKQLQREQNKITWLFRQNNKYFFEATAKADYQKEVLIDTLKQSDFFLEKNIIEPKDAYRDGFDPETKTYHIVPEVEGTTIDFEKMLGEVEIAISNQQDVLDLDKTSCYIEPAVKRDDPDLNAKVDLREVMLKAKITYEFGDQTEVVDSEKISQWIKEDETGISLDRDLVREYVGSLASKYDTYGRKRTIVTVSGESKTLPSGGFGWWMDKASETDELMADIMNGDQKTRTPVYFCKGATYGSDDIGKTYAEIDFNAQHMYLLNNGIIVFESDFVSGNVSKGFGTPEGVFGITYKERNATLVGENYESKVSYWMPFNGNIGFHDASWRNEFGGSIYLFSGSHGCINLPKDKAEQLYDLVYENMPVVAYY